MKENNAKKAVIVNGKTLMVSVDLSKLKHMGYYRFPDGEDVKPFEFFNTGHGFGQFWARISQAMKVHKLEYVVVGFESTGPYGEPLIHYLRKKPVRLVQVNPMHTKRLRELCGNSPNKTDRKDPKVIADVMMLGHFLSLVVPQGVPAELRRLTQARERAMAERTVHFNQLGQLAFVLFPEFVQIMKNLKTKTARYLLRHFPRPENVATCGLEKLSLIVRKISRAKLGAERAKALYDVARDSAGVREGQGSIVFEILHLLDMIEVAESFIACVEHRMSSFLRQVPYSSCLLSVPGIGEVIAAGLIGEAGDFRQFGTIAEITKLAGLDLFEVSSGQHQGQRHISKRGRALMRKLLYFAALNVVRKNGILHHTYQRYLNRGMLKKKALVAISRKLLGIMFALVRDHSQYVWGYTRTQPAVKQAA